MPYRIELSEAAEAEAHAAYLWLSRLNPRFAGRWYNGLLKAIEDLALFPRQWERAPEHGTGARRMLYGTGGSRFRVIFLVVEPEEEDEEGMVRILHVYHGAQRPSTQDDRDEGEETSDDHHP